MVHSRLKIPHFVNKPKQLIINNYGHLKNIYIFEQQSNLLNMRLIRAALGELTDLELAYFATYTAPNLALQTQRKVWLYLSERNLNRTKAKALIELHERTKPEDEAQSCPRCKAEQNSGSSTSLSATATWLTYKDLIKQHKANQPKHWPVRPSQCNICETPIHTKAIPQPSVTGVRVFTNSLRS